jgi:hypothetical protein
MRTLAETIQIVNVRKYTHVNKEFAAQNINGLPVLGYFDIVVNVDCSIDGVVTTLSLSEKDYTFCQMTDGKVYIYPATKKYGTENKRININGGNMVKSADYKWALTPSGAAFMNVINRLAMPLIMKLL